MTDPDQEKFVQPPSAEREFAKEVVSRLREAGHQSLWAGGCVRDSLLGIAPKDYDVATDATPEQIRQIFGKKKTIAIGAAFGVITVLGSKQQGQIEVATFRQDAEYSDGRHPDSVRYSTAEKDAQRRDFTINGLFYDPFADEVIDYVGGMEDLEKKVIRAIGVAEDRIAEDKLRMLRAVRFAATYDFELEKETLSAVQANAEKLSVVSRERVAAEIRRMLAHPQRAVAVQFLSDSHLVRPVFASPLFRLEAIPQAIQHLRLVYSRRFETSMAVLLLHGCREQLVQPGWPRKLSSQLNAWKFSNDESQLIGSILASYSTLIAADESRWPQVQRVLVHEHIEEILAFCESLSRFQDGAYDSCLEYCRSKLQLPAEKLNPPPILSGDDLIKAGMRPGPQFKNVLERIRDQQLMGQVVDFDSALNQAISWLCESET